MAEIRLRDYQNADAENLNRIAVSAFEQFRDHSSDWPAISPIMSVALPMYLKMGFAKAYDAPPIFGVACAVYTKAL
jgi:hypothetical protein